MQSNVLLGMTSHCYMHRGEPMHMMEDSDIECKWCIGTIHHLALKALSLHQCAWVHLAGACPDLVGRDTLEHCSQEPCGTRAPGAVFQAAHSAQSP